jgi:hypothetical protein
MPHGNEADTVLPLAKSFDDVIDAVADDAENMGRSSADL